MHYRWDELLDGQAHLYRAGRDFDVSPDEFAELIEKTAAEFGLTAVVKVDGQFVAFTAGRAVHQPAPPLDYGNDDADAARWSQLNEQGQTFKQIAQEAGVAYQAVWRAVKRHRQAVTAGV
jgi:hypothetical protein